jgi:hypothetical protein
MECVDSVLVEMSVTRELLADLYDRYVLLLARVLYFCSLFSRKSISFFACVYVKVGHAVV